MGCDIHLRIQAYEHDAWTDVAWQPDLSWASQVYRDKCFRAGVPVAPDCFDSRNYNKFAILANVRNGVGFAGIQTGESWPSIAPNRGLPDGVTNDDYQLGDHSYTWMTLDELKAFDWDGTQSWLYGWPITARDASGDWPATVLPWLETLAAGRPLRLVMGFDS